MSHSQKQDLGAQHGQYNGGNTDLTCRNTDLTCRNKIWGRSTVSTPAETLIRCSFWVWPNPTSGRGVRRLGVVGLGGRPYLAYRSCSCMSTKVCVCVRACVCICVCVLVCVSVCVYDC